MVSRAHWLQGTGRWTTPRTTNTHWLGQRRKSNMVWPTSCCPDISPLSSLIITTYLIRTPCIYVISITRPLSAGNRSMDNTTQHTHWLDQRRNPSMVWPASCCPDISPLPSLAPGCCRCACGTGCPGRRRWRCICSTGSTSSIRRPRDTP